MSRGARLPFLLAWMASAFLVAEAKAGEDYFRIHVVDAETGRGVPLVELKTVHNVRHFTDSNGLVAFREPGLTGTKVFFHVKSHGYEYPKDGFGFRGKALNVTAGGKATLKVRRVNLAERLYRVTGAGIYADTLLLGERAPLRRPVINALVLGSDSVLTAVYRGKVYWFWGDTNRAAYPLGNFHVPGATSELPGKGGLDPEKGVDLTYFVDAKGFAKPTAKMPGPGPTWLGGLTVVKDGKGKERMFAGYAKIKPPMVVYERGLVVFDDDKERFEKVRTFPADAPLHPGGHPFQHTEGGVEYIYFASPYPLVRVKADADHLRDPSRYEAYTCLKEGTRAEQGMLDRARDGSLRYSWKKNTAPLGTVEQEKLIRKGKLKPGEALLRLRDVNTGKRVVAHAGSVSWNAYRKRWVMITTEVGGTSFLGEVWYAEADTPLGPWVYARKVVTHQRYSFYNPRHHPFLDKAGGRVIFFEGTYTHTFSGNPEQTPRYDYNQIMYKLDLGDPRVMLPVAVYRTGEGQFTLGDEKGRKEVAFFAHDRPGKGTVPVYGMEGRLRAGKGEGKPLFHALPAGMKDAPATTVPLYEYRHRDGKRRVYTTDAEWTREGFTRSREPVCRVWGAAG
jgi:hypothetical protein